MLRERTFMYLIGDIGNTETKICLFDLNSKIVNRSYIKSNLVTKKYLSKKLKYLKKYKISKILFSSVVPVKFKIIKNFIEKKTGKKCYEIKQINLKKFLNIKVDKKQVGSDRLANAIAVINNKSNFIILDFGTATTFDVVVKNNYLGGVISPGVTLSLNSLVSKASLLPSVNLSKISNVIGKNTKSAIRSGFYWGYLGLINNIIDLIFKNTNKKYNVILTGGLSHLFKNSINVKNNVDKNLTINGLLKVIKKLNK